MIKARITYQIGCDNCGKTSELEIINEKKIGNQPYSNRRFGAGVDSVFNIPDTIPNMPKLPPLWYNTPMNQLVCSEGCLMQIHDKTVEKWKKEQRESYNKKILGQLKQ